MCSWGHVAKNSTACSHEWRAQSTIALVFSTKAWHGQKRSSSGHGHKCQGGIKKRHQHKVAELRAAPEASPTFGPTYWTIVLCLEMSHGNSRTSVMTSCVLCGAQQHAHLFHEGFTSMQQQPSTLELSYSSPSMTQKQHLVPPDWSHE